MPCARLKPAQKRDMVMYLRVCFSVSARHACGVLSLHKSGHYYKAKMDPQTALRIRLRDLAEPQVSYGCRPRVRRPA